MYIYYLEHAHEHDGTCNIKTPVAHPGDEVPEEGFTAHEDELTLRFDWYHSEKAAERARAAIGLTCDIRIQKVAITMEFFALLAKTFMAEFMWAVQEFADARQKVERAQELFECLNLLLHRTVMLRECTNADREELSQIRSEGIEQRSKVGAQLVGLLKPLAIDYGDAIILGGEPLPMDAPLEEQMAGYHHAVWCAFEQMMNALCAMADTTEIEWIYYACRQIHEGTTDIKTSRVLLRDWLHRHPLTPVLH